MYDAERETNPNGFGMISKQEDFFCLNSHSQINHASRDIFSQTESVADRNLK